MCTQDDDEDVLLESTCGGNAVRQRDVREVVVQLLGEDERQLQGAINSSLAQVLSQGSRNFVYKAASQHGVQTQVVNHTERQQDRFGQDTAFGNNPTLALLEVLAEEAQKREHTDDVALRDRRLGAQRLPHEVLRVDDSLGESLGIRGRHSLRHCKPPQDVLHLSILVRRTPQPLDMREGFREGVDLEEVSHDVGCLRLGTAAGGRILLHLQPVGKRRLIGHSWNNVLERFALLSGAALWPVRIPGSDDQQVRVLLRQAVTHGALDQAETR
mmetsp:Transcript_4495/g.15211  ORF Transcript_4495/g.15211 Transcript_4495/m.15211 type:complete len:271 (-) Transcript_4495:170-982(-)